MKKIVFMLQNGIGFGHFKLALTISKYMKDKCDISFITQAKSTVIFDNYDYKVYNFPMLYSLKSNNEILIMNNLINKLIEDIHPDLIIEDTYPEDFYMNLPATKNISKILLMNRLNSTEFENFFYNGVLNQYDKLIVLKEKDVFINEINAKEVKNYATYSDRIVYLNGVFNEPTEDVKEEVERKYNLDNFEKNIVVNCGAGGWHIGNNICEEIFDKVIDVTNNLVKKDMNVQSILVLGPYSKYLEEKYKESINEHIRIVDFETNLDALFTKTDLVILRPGYNTTMETLAGKQNVLLLPGISYMEDQDVWCRELAEIYGIDYINVDNLDNMDSKIEELLNNNKRTSAKPINNTKNVANEILNTLTKNIKNKEVQICVNNLINGNALSLPKNVYNLTENKTIDSIPVLNMSDINFLDYPKYNSFIFVNDINLELNRKSFYTTRYDLTGINKIEYEEVVFLNKDQLFSEITTILDNPQRFTNNIMITLPRLPKNKLDDFTIELEQFIKHNDLNVISLNQILTNCVNESISNYKYGFYRPEITKLS